MFLKKRKSLIALLAAIFAAAFLIAGATAFTQSADRAYATATNGETIDFGSDGITFADKPALDELITTLGGLSYDDLSAKLTAPKTASDFASAKTVTLGGVAFNIMYVSKADYKANGTTAGDVIVTLWQADADTGTDYDSKFNTWREDNTDYAYPSSMYGSSLIRSVVTDKNDVKRKYAKTAGASELTAYNASDDNYKAQLEARWAPFKDSDGAFYGYLATPANMAWQESQYLSTVNSKYLPNDAWDASKLSGGSWENGFDFSSKTTYSDWKNDKVWLPSLTETGKSDDASGLWKTTSTQRANTNNKFTWLRSGEHNGASNAYRLGSSGGNISNFTTNSSAVRPALHLNLKSVVEAATPKPFDVTVGDTTTGYSTIQEAWAAANSAGTATVKMNADATVSQTLVVNSGANITLDLHNCVLALAENASGSVIKVEGAFTATNTPDGGKLTSHDILDPVTNSTKKVNGGVITGGKGSGNNKLGGGVFVAEGGKFTLADYVNIAGNTADFGGGVRLNEGATFIMTSEAEIRYNFATKDGGGLCVYNAAEVEICGYLCYNSALAGGGVYFEGAGDEDYLIKNGYINYNSVSTDVSVPYSGKGGGIYIDGSSVLLSSDENDLGDTSIYENTATKNGGGVYVTENATLKVSGDLFINSNIVDEKNNNVYLEGSTKIKISGSIGESIIYVNNTGEVVTGFTGELPPLNFFKPDDSANGCVWISDEATGTVHIGHAGGAATCTTKAVCTNCNQEYGGFDDTKHTVNAASDICSGCGKSFAAQVTAGESNTFYETFDEAWSAATNAKTATIKMYADASVSKELTLYSKNVTLDLNGHTLTGSANRSVIYIANNGEFTLKDSASGGKITGGAPGVSVSNSTFTMESGEISGNVAATTGGGVFVGANGTFNMKDGKITGNTATRGGGVHIASGTFNMSGGEISYNAATANSGGGVSVYSGTFNVEGSASICYNTKGGSPDNVYFMNGGHINVSGAVSTFTTVYIHNVGAVVTGFTEANNPFDRKASNVFIPDDSANGCVWISDETGGEVTIGHTGGTATCTKKAKCEKCEAEYGELANHTPDAASGICPACNRAFAAQVTAGERSTYFETFDEAWAAALNAKTATVMMYADATVNSTLVVNADANITLNLHNCVLALSPNASGSVIRVEGAFTTTHNAEGTLSEHTVKDPATGTDQTISGGFITGGKGTTVGSDKLGGGVYVASGGTFIMSIGTVAGNTADYGGGVYIGENATFKTQLTAHFIYNKATKGGGGICVCNAKEIIIGGMVSIEDNAALAGGGVYFKGKGDGDYTLTGSGHICNNSVSTDADVPYSGKGGGIYIDGSSVQISGNNMIFTIFVSENTATVNGGGVYVGENATLKVAGKVSISDNQKDEQNNNVYLEESSEITVYGAIAAVTTVYINNVGAVVTGFTEANNPDDRAASDVFIPDDSANGCVWISDEASGEVTIGHSFASEFTVDKQPTCTEKGSKSKHCSHCGEKTEVTEIAISAHTLTHVTAKEATENAVGNIEYWACADCAQYFSDEAGENVITDKTSVTIPLLVPNDSGLSGGAIAGISVGAVIAALLAAYIVCYFVLYRKGILLKGKVFDAVYMPMNAIFNKKQ